MAILTKSFTFTGNELIPDSNVTGLNNILAVSGLPTGVTVTKVTVSNLNITHVFDADLDISLIAPGGLSVDLSSDNGSGGDNFTNTTFDDAGAPVAGAAAPFTGVFKPEALLSTLNSTATNGNWTLKIVDDLGGFTGSLTGWTLNISYVVPDNLIIGTANAESLIGGTADDHIIALAGDDTLLGKEGNDILAGNGAKDIYVFDTALNAATNVDTITGFSHNNDTIHLDNSIFTSLVQGVLKKKNFVIGDEAFKKKQFIIYDDSSGTLSYDADGKRNAFDPIEFAQLQDNIQLGRNDFFVI